MKKFLLLNAIMVLTGSLFAQTLVTVSGTVNNINNNMPVVNHAVIIQTDSVNGAGTTTVVYTNPNGYYIAQFPLSSTANAGLLTVSTYDCQQYLHSFNHTYGPNNYNITQNFLICDNGQSCQANFTYSPAGPLTMQFMDMSMVTNSTARWWNFGDGTTSNLLNPLHTFPAQGYYNVSLTVGVAGTVCYDMITQTIYVGDSVSTGCQAAFTYTAGGNNNRLFSFFDQSVTQLPVTYFWDFGDGTSSTLQNPVHEYPLTNTSVTYNVCLTIISANTVCYDMTCQPVTVAVGQDCNADFDILPAQSNPLSIYFLNQSAGNIQSWTWEFGDGTSQTIVAPGNPNVNHTYTSPGTYTACLLVSGSDSCYSSKCETFLVGDSITGCQAYFSYMNVPGASPNTFQFTNLSQSPTPVSCVWNFGDGTTSTQQNPVHTFPLNPSSVVYEVCLFISNSNGSCTDTYCKTITILPNITCNADFIWIPSPNALNGIYFDDNSTGNIQTWTWDFGDGTTQTINAPASANTYHVYPSPGFYNACLYIQGPDSCFSSVCKTVVVNDSTAVCQAQFTYFPVSSNTANTIQFNDLSSGNITQWFWNFGDGSSSSQQNPEHTFSAPGTYYVCLTVSGPSCQSVWCADVTVTNPVNCANYFTFTVAGLSVNFAGFIVNSAATQNTVYFWDFGDNQTGTGQSVIHNYTSPGIYYVALTTTTNINGISCTYTSSQMVTVSSNTWNQIYGQVYAGNLPATQGMVLLFSLDTANYFVPFVDIAILDSMGVYYFPMVPQGSFIIYAIPFTTGYLPTYYGNVLYWQSATVVTLGTPSNPYNIQLITAGAAGTGPGSISGVVSQGDISTSMVERITMLLSDRDGNVIKYSQVDAAGKFEFPVLSYGRYLLHAELAGCESQDIEIEISEMNANAYVTLTLSGHNILGGYDAPEVPLLAVIAPNPAKDRVVVNLQSDRNTKAIFEIYNMASQRVMAAEEYLSAGQNKVIIPVDYLKQGIYLMKIFTGDGLQITRKLVITQ